MMKLFEITPDQLPGLGLTNSIVRQYAELSTPLIVALWDQTPTSFIGLIPQQVGVYIWMHALPATAEHKLATARHAKDLIRRAVLCWGMVCGHCNDPKSERWLRTLGAMFFPTIPHYFEIR